MSARPRVRDLVALAAWLVLLSLVVGALHAFDDGSLSAPPLHGLSAWLDDRGPAVAAFSMLRLVTLGLGWYLLVATAAALGCRLGRAHGMAHLVERASPAVIGRLVRAVAGVALAAGSFGGGAASMGGIVAASAETPSGPDPAAITMRDLDTPVAGDAGPADDSITMRRIPDDDVDAAPAPAPAPTTAPVWTVRPGDSFWHIAGRTVATAWGRDPSTVELDPYWRALIEANRARLADRANADLLFPGQELVLLPVPPAPTAADT